MALTSGDKGLLCVRVRQSKARCRLQLLYPKPTVTKREVRVGEHDTALFIGVENAQVVVLSGSGVVGGIPDLERHIFDSIMCDGIFLDDLDGRALIILEIDIPIPVGEQRHHLRLLGQQVGLRDRLFDDLHDAGQQVLHHGDAVPVRLHFRGRVAVRTFHQIDRMLNRLPGVGVGFMDIEVGALVVGQSDRTGLAREQFYMVLGIVRDVVLHRGQFADGINARLQIGNQDLAIGIGGAVQVVAAVLNPGDAESHPGQPGAIAAQFDKLEGGLDMVGKNELGVFIWLQLNDALGLIDDVAITGFFSYHIGAGREHRQVDFSALVSPELLGAIGPLHRFDLEYSVGDYLGGIVGIHLDEL